MSKNKIVVLSDIHIGTNAPTVWYQKDLHEPYLIKVLDYIIQQKDSIRELILLGDIVDFWTYPPDERPPSFEDIVKDNPKIFGEHGKLSEVLTALEGNVTYVRGNHDMNITQEDLKLIKNPNYTITLCDDPNDVYFPLGNEDRRILCTHGHHYTMFNAPDTETKFAPLPIGHFVTRAVSYHVQQIIERDESVKTVADLEGQGAPNSPNAIDLAQLVHPIVQHHDLDNLNIAEILLDYIAKHTNTNMLKDKEFILPNGEKTTIEEAKRDYSQLLQQWIHKYDGGNKGKIIAGKAAIADNDGQYMGFFSQKLAFEYGADLVVMGHTHTPISGLETSLVQYLNSGFECPTRPDINQTHKRFTFIEINTDNCNGEVKQIFRNSDSYQIEPYNAQKDSVVYSFSRDYSCYIIVDNTNGTSELELVEHDAKHGYYVVAPPKRIPAGKQGRFWIQDYPAFLNLQNVVEGTDGKVTYKYFNSGKQVTFSFGCPVGAWTTNFCSGADFHTSVDGVHWEAKNEIKGFDLRNPAQKLHPFFVRFVL